MLTNDKLHEAAHFNQNRGYPEKLDREEFVRILYAAQADAGLDLDGKYGDDSRAEFSVGDETVIVTPGDIDYAKVFAGGVHPMPIYGGIKPMLTSGFIAKSGRGPNKARLEDTGRPHYGGDLGYKRLSGQPPPLGWEKYHFTNRRERMFYCPPVGIASILDGEVEYADLLPVSEFWGGPRFTLRIYHGELEGFGHFSTWSTHHSELHVSAGQTVSAGQIIATAGDTGCPGAPHNHQEGWCWQTGENFTREEHALDLAPILPHLELRAA